MSDSDVDEKGDKLILSQSQGTPHLVIPHKQKKKKKKTSGTTMSRKSDAEIRKLMKEENKAILLKLTRKDDAKLNTAWAAIEKFGFTVSKDGCLLPYDRFWPHSGQSGLKLGHICAAVTFNDVKLSELGKRGSTNEFGWPSNHQVSHLCHISMCCNPAHLCLEPTWKNLKRNYCGLEGKCDCGLSPTCLLTYRSNSTDFPINCCSYSTSSLREFIQSHVGDNVKVKVLPANYYRKQDIKRANKKKRKKSTQVHRKQTEERKVKRLKNV